MSHEAYHRKRRHSKRKSKRDAKARAELQFLETKLKIESRRPSQEGVDPQIVLGLVAQLQAVYEKIEELTQYLEKLLTEIEAHLIEAGVQPKRE